jgi:hypothetical protein
VGLLSPVPQWTRIIIIIVSSSQCGYTASNMHHHFQSISSLPFHSFILVCGTSYVGYYYTDYKRNYEEPHVDDDNDRGQQEERMH